MDFTLDCIRSAESKLLSTLRISSRTIKRPNDTEAFSSSVKSGTPIISKQKLNITFACNKKLCFCKN